MAEADIKSFLLQTTCFQAFLGFSQHVTPTSTDSAMKIPKYGLIPPFCSQNKKIQNGV